MSLTHFSPFGDPLRQLDRLTSQLLSGTRIPIAMPIDVWRSADGYHVDLDLPGVDPGSIDVTCEKNILTVRAQRQPEFGQADEVLLAERSQGSFTRQLQLGDALDPDRIQASYTNGVLCLTIPAAQQEQPRRIEVSSGSGQQQVQISGETEDDEQAGSDTPGSQSSEPAEVPGTSEQPQ